MKANLAAAAPAARAAVAPAAAMTGAVGAGRSRVHAPEREDEAAVSLLAARHGRR